MSRSFSVCGGCGCDETFCTCEPKGQPKFNQETINKVMLIIDDKSTSSNQEIIWVDKEWKGIIEKMTNAKAVQKEVVRSVAEFKYELDCDVEYADSVVDTFRNRMVKMREDIKQMYKEEIRLNEEIYTELDSKREEIRKKIKYVTEELQSGLSEELRKVSRGLQDLNIYGLDKLVEFIQKFEQMSDKDKEILRTAFGAYKGDK